VVSVDVQADDGESELLDVRPRWVSPRWLVRAAGGIAAAGALATVVTAALTPPAESGHGSYRLPTPPAHQVQLYQPLRGHYLL
jgi:hypothetical protein